jgi:hypothetical protein
MIESKHSYHFAIRPTIQFLIFLILTSQLCFACDNYDNNTEQILYSSIKASYKNKNIDIEKELDTLEADLISAGHLKSNTGSAYYAFFEEIVKRNDFSIFLNADKYTHIYQVKPTEMYSLDSLLKLKEIDSSQLSKSKTYKLSIKMKEVKASDDFSASQVAGGIIEILSPKDFDIPYFRAISLISIAYTLKINSEYISSSLQELKPLLIFKSQQLKAKIRENRPKMIITVTKDDEIVLNKKVISFIEMMTEVKTFIKKHGKEHWIELKNEKGTSYGFYFKVNNSINEVYDDLLNKKAVELFKKPYKSLSTSERKTINDFYPKNLKTD